MPEASTLVARAVPRVFFFNGLRMDDPNPELPADRTRSVFSALYPDINTATLSGPRIVGREEHWHFERRITEKG